MRLLGLRRVDAHTAGPVSPRSATLLRVTATATEQIGRALNRPSQERDRAKRATADEEVARIGAANPDAAREAITDETERLAGTVVIRDR